MICYKEPRIHGVPQGSALFLQVLIRYFLFTGGKLASLEEFKVQKEDLMKKFEMMEASLADQKKGHEEFVYDLERKQVVDKDR